MKNVRSAYKGFLLSTHEIPDGGYVVHFWRVGESCYKYKTVKTVTGREARRLARLTINSLLDFVPRINRARFAEGGGE